jgi:hypothetical protein
MSHFPVFSHAFSDRPAAAAGASIALLSVLKIAELNLAKSYQKYHNFHIDERRDFEIVRAIK